MLATNDRICPPYTYIRSNKLRAYRHVLLSALLLLALCVASAVPTLAQVSGQNVNMVSGTNWTNGDPFLQRQNEPSIAVSSRNSSHLLAGANDYRTVDLPGLLGIDERGDAWLGLFKSFDAGRTWQSTLLPGFPLDGSQQGQNSPIHGFQAASDPAVRAGTNGLFYYTGLAFNRGNNPRSAVFVSRFIDLNNKENGNATFEGGSMTNLQPRDTIKYVDTTAVAQGIIATGPQSFPTFLDKPWVAVDIPRGSSTCTISVDEDGKTITQTIPAAPVYLTYTSFDVSRQFSTINFTRSLDCGATWSSPTILSRNDEASGDAEHQGTVIAIDPSVPPSQPATVYVAWRRFASVSDPGDPPAIFLAKSADGGAHWGTPFAVVVFPNSCIPTVQNPNPTGVGCPFDQVFTNATFRSNGYPALTVDSFGRVYVAWSQRDANGDGKIMMGIAPGGRSIQSASIAAVDIGQVADDDGNAFSNLSGRGSQLMPSLSFEAGKLMLAYYDLRQDHTTGTFVEAPNPNCDAMVTLPCALGAQYLESRTLEGEISPPNPSNSPSVFGPYVADSAPPLTARRHTIDVMGAEAVPPPAASLQPPSFKAFRITNYLFGSIPQLFQDVEQIQFNAPNLPLFVDGTAPFMGDYIDVSGTPQIIPDGKGGWTFNTTPSANPVFHATWTDNRDVVPPADGNWRNYTPPISASNPGSQPSKFDPTQQPLACVIGQTGMRNQNVYTAEISQGVILTSPQTSKPVLTPGGLPIQRAFVVEVRNATNAARSFQVSIPSQPATATASFQQFGSLTTQTVKVNAFSSQSLPVFVVANAGSIVAFPSVLVTATENDGANPPLTGSVLLNPDPTNPALTGPDNAAIGGSQIAVNEFYNPGVANPGVANSGVASPGVANPGVANPGVANPGVANPTVVLALNPGVANPGVANPGVANPGVANPGVANESVTDASYTFTNEGNTSAAYTIQFFQSAPFPAGAKFQIILSKVYFTEQAVGCQIQQVGSNVIVANVTNPVFVTDPTQLGNPGVANLGVQTPTINLAPGDSGQVTIRTNLSVAQVESQVLPNVSPVAVSQSVNTVDVQHGIFTPPLNLLITSTSASVPTGEVNLPYNTTLTSIGGNSGLRNWTIASGSLPPGLQLNAATGAITGTPTLAGSFPFTAQVTDIGTPQHTATRALTITIVAPVTIATPSPAIPEGGSGSPYAQTFSASGGVPPYTWSSTGTLPSGLTLSSSGTLSGTPTAGGTFNFTVKVTDALGLLASASYTVLITNAAPAGAQIQFITQPTSTTAGQAISPAVRVQILGASGTAIPGVTVTLGAGGGANRPILSGTLSVVTDASGVATFSNVVIDRAGTGFTLIATPAGASSSGAVHAIPAPPSVQLGALESDTQIQFFGERRGVSLSSSVGVDISAPGNYTSVAGLTTGAISAGTIVDSYYLHADPVGISGNIVQLEAGAATFPTDVLGVIVLDPSLTASDPAVGVLGTSYPNGGRALELGSPTDTAILSADRRTVTLHLSNSSASDDVRVITAANPNASLSPITSAAFNSVATAGSISTVAGSTWVFPGAGPATNAPLGLGADVVGGRVGVVADAVGNVYVADPNNHMVFRVTGGTLSIFAGTGVEGYFGDGGLATAARLDFPVAVALSPAGELYIADNSNSVIRKVDATGKITTVVGVGFPGYFGDGGQAVNAGLNFPEGISFDPAGNLFIADTFNGVIRKVDPSGIITTLATTNLPANSPGLCLPEDVAARATGVVYVADSCDDQVFTLDSGGNLTVVAGNGTTLGYSGDGGPAVNASLLNPVALTVDGGGNLYIADEGNNVVRKVDTSGTITTVVGNGGFGFAGDGGPGLLASLAQPGALAFDPFGNLYIGDTSSERIRKVDTSGTITTVAGTGRFKYAGDGGAATSGSLDAPTGVAVDPAGDLFTSDIANLVVRKVTSAGVISTYAGTGVPAPTYTGDGGPATAATLHFPGDVQVDGAGNLYVSEGGRVHKITPSGIITTLLSGGPNNSVFLANGGLSRTGKIALDSQGNVYFSDADSSRVLKLDTTGAVTVVAGTGKRGFSGDGGPATLATLRQPRGVAVDPAGNLYIADPGNHRVRRVDPNGTITTVAGNGSMAFSGDGGPAISAGLPNPFGLTVDGAGNLFIGDADRVRKVDAGGTINTIAGGGYFESTVDGIPATNAAFTNVQGLAFDAAGNLYLSDRFNDRIRKVTGVTTTPPFIFTPPSGLTVTTKGLPHGDVGVPYIQTLSAVGGAPPYTWSLASGTLPAGLNLSSAGQISGTPTTAGPFAVVVKVTDASGATATQPLTIAIDVPVVITTTSLPAGTMGVAYSQTLTATGGAGTYTWSFASGTLPPGITLANSGLLSGTPTTGGTFTFTVQVADLSLPAHTATQTLSIQVGTTAVPAGAHILFIIQPPGPMGGGSTGLQAVVQLFDANNAPIAGAQLSASFGAKPCPDAALSGTLTAVTDSNGLAVFSGITSNRGGNGYTGVATATSNPQVFATSIPFSIQGFCPAGTLTTLRRENTVTLLPNGKVLILGGLNSNSLPASALSTAELYDPATGVFTPTGNMTTPRDLSTATVLPNGKVLVVGGYDATTATLTSAELYDPATGVFTATGSMSVPRQEHTATLLPNGKVLIAGGVKWAFPTTFYASAEIYDPATGQFTLTGTMNSAHVDHTATLLSNGKVLVASGEGSTNTDGSNQQITSIAEIYDPSAGTFTPTGSLTTARFNQAATTLSDGRVLVTGGYSVVASRTATASAEIYDPTTGAFTPTGSMTVARAEHASTSLPNGGVLVAGGFSSLGFFGGTQLSTAEAYNPITGNFKGPANMAFGHSRIVAPLLPNGAVLFASGSTAELFFPTGPPFLVQEFTATGNLNTGRTDHTATLLSNGLVLIAGGQGSSGVALANTELYNSISGAFTATGSLNTARYNHTATLLTNGLVLIAGGLGSPSGPFIANAELYNPATGNFTATGSLTIGRAAHTATLLYNGLVLIAGGQDSSGNSSASAELYNPATGNFTATGSLNTARYLHTATLLNNGLVLIAGGFSSSGGTLASSELYNPATGTFTATGSLNTARNIHTATLLSNGLVLIAGGLGSSGITLASSELYNPAAGTFTATGSLNTARIFHPATLLNNGLVLIAGGFSSSGGTLASAELYNPATGTFTATSTLNAARSSHTATLLPTGKVLLAGGTGNTAELFQFGAIQQLAPQSCSYEGHIKSIAAFSTPTAVRFVNNSTSLTFQVFWLDYNGNRVLYATLGPGQSLLQQTFLTHPWLIADTSPAATCQEIYLPLQEQAPAIFPPAQISHFLVDTGPGNTVPLWGLFASDSTGNFQFLAGQFTLVGGATLDSVQTWMDVGIGGSLEVKISTDNGGLPGSSIFSKTYTVPGAQAVGWVPFSNYNVVLAAGTYWLSFEPVAGSNFSGGVPAGAPNPLAKYAFFNNGNPGYLIFATSIGMRISGTSP